MNACAPEPGSGGVCAPRNPRSATWSRRVRPWGNACGKVPGADGAAIPPNATGIAPCRGTSGSSMLSAPAARSATMLVALASAAERLIAVARWGVPDATKHRCGWATVASRRPPSELRCAVSLLPPSVRSSHRGSTARGGAADRLCGGSGPCDVVHGDRHGPPRHPSGPSRSSRRAGSPRSRCAWRLRLQPSAGRWARCARAGRPTSSEPIRPGPPPSPWTARVRGWRTAGTPAAHLLAHGDVLRPHPRPRPPGDTCRDRAVPDDPHDLGGTGTAQCALPASAAERPSVVRRIGCTSSATSPTARTPQPSARVREMSFRPFDRPLKLLGLS